MDIEKIATSAIVTTLSKNERLSSFINSGDKEPSAELFEAAKEMCTWLASYPEFASDEVITINSLQITLRERPLSFEEKSTLYSIKSEHSFC